MSPTDLIQALTLLIPALIAWRSRRVWATLLAAGALQLLGAGMNTYLLDLMPGLYDPAPTQDGLAETYYLTMPTGYFMTISMVCIGLSLPLWVLERRNRLLARPLAWAATFSLLLAQTISWFLPRLVLATAEPESFDQIRALSTKLNTSSAVLLISMPLAVALLIAVMTLSAVRRD